MVNTAVLFETFARVDYARQVFDSIKKAQPKKLYFYSNKAREDHPDEIERNNEIRSWIKEIDWSCELHTFFRNEYVDIYTSLKGSLNWAFENEEQVIILEEDCVPSLAFFDFCEQMLEKYREDKRIWIISGDNYFENYNPNGYDYIFSHYIDIFGWASWRDRWNQILWGRPMIDEMKSYGVFDSYYNSKRERDFHTKRFKRTDIFIRKTHCWDLTFVLTIIKNGGLSIIPSRNLVSDIGLIGIHGNGKKRKITGCKHIANVDKFYISKEPSFVIEDYKYDEYMFKHRFKRYTKFYYILYILVQKSLKKIIGDKYYKIIKKIIYPYSVSNQ